MTDTACGLNRLCTGLNHLTQPKQPPPPPRDGTITSRIRSAAIYHWPVTRTKRFLHPRPVGPLLSAKLPIKCFHFPHNVFHSRFLTCVWALVSFYLCICCGTYYNLVFCTILCNLVVLCCYWNNKLTYLPNLFLAASSLANHLTRMRCTSCSELLLWELRGQPLATWAVWWLNFELWQLTGAKCHPTKHTLAGMIQCHSRSPAMTLFNRAWMTFYYYSTVSTSPSCTVRFLR